MFLIPFILFGLFVLLHSFVLSLQDIKAEKGLDDWHWSEADRRYFMIIERPRINYDLWIYGIETDGRKYCWARVTRDMVFQQTYVPKIEIVKGRVRIEVWEYARLPLSVHYCYCGEK